MPKIYALLFAATMFTPSAAGAAPIPQSVLDEYASSCQASCQQTGEAGQCAELCGCVSQKMSNAWTAEDFNRHAQAYEKDPNDPAVRREVDGFIQQCVQTM